MPRRRRKKKGPPRRPFTRIVHTPHQLYLFKKYSLSSAQCALFDLLRHEHPRGHEHYLSDFRILQLLCAKKTYDKCVAMIPKFHSLLVDVGIIEPAPEPAPPASAGGSAPPEAEAEGGAGGGPAVDPVDPRADDPEWDEHVKEITDEDFRKTPYLREMFSWQAMFAPPGFETLEGHPLFQVDYGKMRRTKSAEQRKVMLMFWIRFVDHFMRSNPKHYEQLTRTIADFKAEKMGSRVLKGYPIRFKKMIMFSTPWYITLLVALVRPFYTGKIMKRLIVCRKQKLTKFIGTDNLLQRWGGTRTFDYVKWVREDLGFVSYGLTDDEIARGVYREEEDDEGVAAAAVAPSVPFEESEGLREEDVRKQIDAIKKGAM